jgi:mannose-6-phosphate isomerase-like protein (cupin superfamily)
MRRAFTQKDGEQWDATDGFPRPVHLMIEPRTAGSEQLAMGVQEVPPGSRIAVHVHKHGEELIFFYQGRGRMRIGDEELEVGPETAVLIPKGTPHGFVNTSGETVRLTWTFSPPGEHERFRDVERWKHVSGPAPDATS